MQEAQLVAWDRLTSSPYPSVGRSSSNVSSLDLDEFVSESENEDECEMETYSKQLDSAIHIEGIGSAFAYAFFVRDKTYSFLRSASGLLLENKRPVIPVCLEAQSIAWNPHLLINGAFAHEFRLLHGGDGGDGALVATLRLHPDLSLTLTHSHHSLISQKAGLAPPSLQLSWASLPARRRELLELFGKIESSSMYLPTSEIVVGAPLTPGSDSFLTPRIPPEVASHELACHAHDAWLAVCHELVALSALVINACKQHNAAEFARCGG